MDKSFHEIEFAQTSLTPAEKLELRMKTGKKKISDAIREAVLFYNRVHPIDDPLDDEGEDNE